MNTRIKSGLNILSVAVLGLMASAPALAIDIGSGGGGGGGSGDGFTRLYNDSDGNGNCRVSRVRAGDSTLYIPSDPSNSSARFNVLVWGNGTGGTASTYTGMLESVASHCIAVAAANTENSGSGREMAAAYQELRSRYGNILASTPRVCTAGHSQGGGGSFNAAPQVNADCVIPVQPDTRFTVQIQQPLDSDVEVITLWGSSDTLAPASGNARNVERNSTILTQVETDGEGHFAPVGGTGGNIGTLFRMANIAQLSNDPSRSSEYRSVFFGPDNANTVTESNRDISEVNRNAAARAVTP